MKKFFIFVLLIIFVSISLLFSLPPLVITEVAPGETGTKDWVEIFVSSSGDYGGWKLCSGYPQKIIKVLPSRNYSRGDIIVIIMNTQKEDMTEKQNYWIFYSSDTEGLYDSEGILYLVDVNNNWIDAVGWSNRDGDISKTACTAYNEMKKNNMWVDGPEQAIDGTNDAEVQNSLVDWSDGAKRDGASIQRYKDFNGLPKDTNSLSDWFYSKTATMGYGYKEVVSETQKVVEVDKNTNPFCPEDTNNNFVKINFNIPEFEAEKTIIIYDISGNEIIKLLDKDRLPNGNLSVYKSVNKGNITWDGKNKEGFRVATGVYVVYFEAYNPNNGNKYVGKDIVVVGRKW